MISGVDNVLVREVSISGKVASLIGDCNGKPKTIDMPIHIFRQFCRQNPDTQFPFTGLLAEDPDTSETYFHLIEVEENE